LARFKNYAYFLKGEEVDTSIEGSYWVVATDENQKGIAGPFIINKHDPQVKLDIHCEF